MLTDLELYRALACVHFTDPDAAQRCLLRLSDEPEARAALEAFLPHLSAALTDAAEPDRVLVNFERFLSNVPDRVGQLRYFARRPRAVEILVSLFAGSQFLTEILLSHPAYFERLMEQLRLVEVHDTETLTAEIQSALLDVETFTAQLDALRRVQRWELLRIGVCDLLDLLDLPTVTLALSHLADSLVGAALELAFAQAGVSPGGFVVLAMGKLGGKELNYSSDIDLLFLAKRDATAYLRPAERLIRALTQATTEGFLYRVDMRLRPWGQVGMLVTSLDGYMRYLAEYARLWEKQALLKARVIAGDTALGAEFLHRVTPLIYDVQAEFVRADVYAMRQRTEDGLQQQGRGWGEVKLGAGSIRDVEFVAQYLQLAHGGTHPELRSRMTLDALDRLAAGGWLTPEEQRVLSDGYTFLRTVEHYLQLRHYQQTHTLPAEPAALARLARRLGFQGEDAGAQFLARYEQHRAAIRRIYLRHLGGEGMKQKIGSTKSSQTPDVNRHLERMDPSYANAFSPKEIERHAVLAARLDDAHLAEVEAEPLEEEHWRVTIVAHDYPGELSLICGLLFVHGFSIDAGNVFTYEPDAAATAHDWRRKIVDVFTVHAVREPATAETWARYADDLTDLLQLMHARERRDARGELAKRVAATLQDVAPAPETLYPVDIEIDNAASERYTVLRIDAPDTPGFLYEFTNALAYNRIYIAQVTVDSVGNRVQDVLYVTDKDGHKITSPERQRELRVATVLIKHFTHLLPHTPNPETALLHFREFIGQLFQRDDWPAELASLRRPKVLQALARLLGVSDFLWDDFLRMQHANLFPVVRDLDALDTMKTRPQLQAELEAELLPVHDGPCPPSQDAPWQKTLNAFKDREMFRIDMRHILGHTEEFWDFSEELTDLAEVMVNSAYHLCHEDLRTVHGTPQLENGGLCEMTVCALGKCGGRELGFASDIELMFIYSGTGQTTGPDVISTVAFYEKVVQYVLNVIEAKREGIFEIDLQLRPYGKAGSLAVSVEAFRRYFVPNGPAWAYERQALVKLRPIAGNAILGAEVAALAEAFVYEGNGFDVTAMRAMRERQVRHLVAGGTFNAKYSPGGLVDLEYLVQGLQITHGAENPALRQTNIRAALAALAEAGMLSEEDYTRLRKAHTFLRWLIDALRVVRGNAKDLTVPPADSEAFAFLARRLRYGSDVARLRVDLEHYTTSVQELSARLL